MFRDDGIFAAAFFVPQEFDDLWMGKRFGEALRLTETFSTGDIGLLERGRELAAKAAVDDAAHGHADTEAGARLRWSDA